ncbi:MAG: hypothetical protein AAFV59_02820 [Pseudomonadota bacterium]
MLSVLKFETQVRIIAVLTVLVCALLLLSGLAGGVWGLITSAGLISLLVLGLLLPLYIRSWFHAVYRCLRGPKFVFPLLDGEWHGEIESNWSLVKKMLAVSSGKEQGPFDPLNADPNDLEWDPPVQVVATIVSGFLDFEMTMLMTGTKRHSETLSVSLDRTEKKRPRLRYIFRQTDDSLKIQPTDRDSHLGSAELILSEDGTTLSGRYWTDRVGEKGLNTAGRLVLRRSV